MSYSFGVVAATKAIALAMIAAEFDKVVAAQPVHANDRQAAESAAIALVNQVADPKDSECVRVSVCGSLGWIAENTFTTASVSVTAQVSPKIDASPSS